MGSLIVGRLRGGVDIRKLGSGNAGGTNALRTQGGLFAFWVMLIDIGKGFIATRIIAPLRACRASRRRSGRLARVDCRCCAASPSIVGHVYPMWYGFRGGKGVATLIGVLLGLEVWLLVPMLVTWLVVVMLFGYRRVWRRWPPRFRCRRMSPRAASSRYEPLARLRSRRRRADHVHASTQHRAHARGQGAARAPTVAAGSWPWLSAKRHCAATRAPGVFRAAVGRRVPFRRGTGACARRDAQRRVEGREGAARSRHVDGSGAQSRLPNPQTPASRWMRRAFAPRSRVTCARASSQRRGGMVDRFDQHARWWRDPIHRRVRAKCCSRNFRRPAAAGAGGNGSRRRAARSVFR